MFLTCQWTDRSALGASPRSLVRLLVHQTLAPASAGIALGTIGAVWLGRIAESQLRRVKGEDPLVIGGAVVTVAAAALVAAYIPARHARQVDPIVILRAE